MLSVCQTVKDRSIFSLSSNKILTIFLFVTSSGITFHIKYFYFDNFLHRCTILASEWSHCWYRQFLKLLPNKEQGGKISILFPSLCSISLFSQELVAHAQESVSVCTQSGLLQTSYKSKLTLKSFVLEWKQLYLLY